MKLEDVLTAGQIGQLDRGCGSQNDGAQQRRIETVGAIGCGKDNDTLVVIEAIHLGQQLIERLLTLVVAAKTAAIALLTDGIDPRR